MKENHNEIIVYKPKEDKAGIEVQFDKQTVWLTQQQITRLFGRERSVITKHITNVFGERELEKKSNVQKMHIANSDKPVTFYSLDVVISVGYRVKSKRGTQFRIWATRILRDRLLAEGREESREKQARIRTSVNELLRMINFVTEINSSTISTDEAKGLLSIIRHYALTWSTLEAYDSGNIQKQISSQKSISLTPEEVRNKLGELKRELIRKGEASDLFAIERNHGIEQILGAVDQTFGGQELYPSIEEKAAHLFYFTIKDHPFSDGNKRSGAFIFLEFLRKNNALLKKDGAIKISDTALTALALLIAESNPKEKEQMIALITNLLKN